MKHPIALRATFNLRVAALMLLLGITACSPSAPPSTSAPVSPAATEQRNFTGTWSVAGNRQSLPMGAGRRAETFRLGGSLMLAGEKRPGLAFRSEVIGFTDSHTGVQGRSVWTDERGDQVFSELRGGTAGPGQLIEGRFVGGTGRYAGVSGEYSFKWQSLVETEDGGLSGRVVGLKGWARLASPQSPPDAPSEGAPPIAGAKP